jgi:hypothetical protein
MWLKDILTSDVGSGTFVAGILMLCFWGIRRITQIESNHKTLTDINCKLDSHIDEIRRDIAYIKGSYDIMKSSNNNTLMQSHSPISLTEKGKQVAKELGAYNIIERNWGSIKDLLEANVEGKNPYDIQQYCIETVSVEPDKFFIKSDLDKIKQYAYANGQPLDLYTRMIAILIRDKFFKEHNIDPLDIDKYESLGTEE